MGKRAYARSQSCVEADERDKSDPTMLSYRGWKYPNPSLIHRQKLHLSQFLQSAKNQLGFANHPPCFSVRTPARLYSMLLTVQSAPTARTSSPYPSQTEAPIVSSAEPVPTSTPLSTQYTLDANSSARSVKMSLAVLARGTMRKRVACNAPTMAAMATRRPSSRCKSAVQTNR